MCTHLGAEYIYILLHGKYWFETNIFSLTLLYVYSFWCGIYLHYYMESIGLKLIFSH